MKVALTDRYIRGLRPKADGKRYQISDARQVGLRVQVLPDPSGSHGCRRTFYCEYTIRPRKIRKRLLGDYPALSLAQARVMAVELVQEGRQGIDRKAIEQAQRESEAASISVTDALDLYYQSRLSRLRTANAAFRELRNGLDHVASLPVTQLAHSHLQTRIDAKGAEGKITAGNRLKANFSTFSKWLFQQGYSETDLSARLVKAGKERPREVVLTVEEVQAIWRALDGLSGPFASAFRLLILTGQRVSEITGLRWSEIDLDARTITKAGSQTKNGKSHVTHLSEAAIAALPKRGNSDLVFTTNGKTPISGRSQAKARLDELLPTGFKHWTLHDLRTALATALAGAGHSEGVVDRILNHSASGSAPSQVARVYNQAAFLPERARALDHWADIVTGEAAKVVKLHG